MLILVFVPSISNRSFIKIWELRFFQMWAKNGEIGCVLEKNTIASVFEKLRIENGALSDMISQKFKNFLDFEIWFRSRIIFVNINLLSESFIILAFPWYVASKSRFIFVNMILLSKSYYVLVIPWYVASKSRFIFAIMILLSKSYFVLVIMWNRLSIQKLY